MEIVRLAALTPRRWKNGGGATREYAVHPQGAGLDDFEWRVSRAEIRADGPFSAFAGIDRTLTVLSGAGVALDFADRVVRLDAISEPFAFAGEAPVAARLVGGAIEDLNVMTRRGRWRHTVARVAAEPGERLAPPGERFAAEGDLRHLLALTPCRIAVGGGEEALAAGDLLRLGGGETATLASSAPGCFLSIRLLRLAGA